MGETAEYAPFKARASHLFAELKETNRGANTAPERFARIAHDGSVDLLLETLILGQGDHPEAFQSEGWRGRGARLASVCLECGGNMGTDNYNEVQTLSNCIYRNIKAEVSDLQKLPWWARHSLLHDIRSLIDKLLFDSRER